MKTKIAFLSLVFFCLVYGKTALYAQQNADDLLTKMDQTIFGIKDKTANIEMLMTNLKTGKQKQKKAILLQKGANKKLFRYTSPKSDSGIATLSLPNDEIYLYLPLFKKPKKITNIAESNTFNKSDFSVKDMATKPYAEKYTPEMRPTNDTAYVLYLKPKTDDSPYNHLIVYINKIYFYPEKFEFYDRKEKKVKQSIYHYILIDGHWIADVVSMEDLKKRHKTRITMSEIKINQGLKDELFTVENMAGNN